MKLYAQTTTPYLPIFILLAICVSSFPLSAQLLINELCPSNDQTIEDEFGDSSDWIELYNANEAAINLESYFLSDDPTDPLKWALPNRTIEAGAWLLVFASDRDLVGVNLHTNFKLSAGGESVVLSTADGTILDQVTYPELATDQSMGRLQDGSPEWALFTGPTPAYSNNDGQGSGFSSPPEWVTEGHFFAQPTTIELRHTDPQASFYFTRDGSAPNNDDEHYTGAIQLDTTTVIRVVAIIPGQLSSTILSRTFFIGSQHVLPIISIVGEPDAFWSWENGILVDGGPNAEEEWPYWGANYWADIEVPIHFEFFSAEQSLLFSERADTKIHGGRGARTNPLKSLRFLFKKKYGTNTVEYPFFEDRQRTTYKRLVLRNASGDYNNGHFRDAFLARYFIKEGFNLDVLAHRPVVVYVNGEYYGVENLREKSDQYYIQNNYGIDPDNLDLLEEDTAVTVGDFVAFDSMLQFVLTHDMSQAQHFEQATTYFDVENIAEGYVVQTALNNNDWIHNNIKYWRERREGARWRYLIFDMDSALGRYGWSGYSENNINRFLINLAGINKHVDLFLALLENDEYRYYFINRYADLLNSSFRSEIFQKEVDLTVAEIEPEMPLHFNRWTWPGFENWKDTRIPVIYDYVENRPPFARQHLREYFQLTGEVELSLQTYPPGAGLIKINTIKPEELPWDGIYFQGVPVTLTIEPTAGYTFSHWQSDKTITNEDKASTIRYDFQEDDSVIAYFTQAESGIQLSVQLETISNTAIATIGLGAPEELAFSLYDMSGRLLSAYPQRALSGGSQLINFSLPELSSGMYLLQARSATQQVVAKFIKL